MNPVFPLDRGDYNSPTYEATAHVKYFVQCLAHGEKLAHSFILSANNHCTPAMCSEAEDTVETKTEEVLVSRKFIF